MKYLSVLVFAVLLSSTWYIISSEAAIPLETHVGIQSKLGQLILDSVRAKKPSATAVQVDSVWTEPAGTNPVRVRAHFAYRFSESSGESGKTETSIKGEGILVKQSDDGSGFDKWSLTDVKTSNDSLVFQDAMVITTGGDEPPPLPAGLQQQNPADPAVPSSKE